MWKKWLSKERMNSMVGAEFDSAEAAKAAVDAIRAEPGVDLTGLHVIHPSDPEIDRKLEPESSGIAGTLWRAHLRLGALGLFLGLVVALALVTLGIQPFTASPTLSIVVITGFATIAGLLLGGFFSLRPDHDPIIHDAKSATRSGQWYVVVHMRKPEVRDRVERLLHRFNDDTMRTA